MQLYDGTEKWYCNFLLMLLDAGCVYLYVQESEIKGQFYQSYCTCEKGLAAAKLKFKQMLTKLEPENFWCFCLKNEWNIAADESANG